MSSIPVLVVTPISGPQPLTVVGSIHNADGDQLMGDIDWSYGDHFADDSGTDVSHTYTNEGTYSLVVTTSLLGQFTTTVNVGAEVPLQAVDDSFNVNSSPFTASVATNDVPGSNSASPFWQLATQPQHGTIDSWPQDGTFVYTPTSGYSGADSFTYDLVDYRSDQQSTATVSLTIAGSTPTNPSIRAWYNGQQVYLGVQANALVFDGDSFIRPQDAKTVAIVEVVVVGPETVPGPWPETQTLDQATLTWTNVWLCTVIAIDQLSISDIDVVAVNDPNNGLCLCGVSCIGIALQYVVVTPVTGP